MIAVRIQIATVNPAAPGPTFPAIGSAGSTQDDLDDGFSSPQ
jgi:hypothetical protein